jgi:hypothetical protein
MTRCIPAKNATAQMCYTSALSSNYIEILYLFYRLIFMCVWLQK